jgi:hypothetical protein
MPDDNLMKKGGVGYEAVRRWGLKAFALLSSRPGSRGARRLPDTAGEGGCLRPPALDLALQGGTVSGERATQLRFPPE